MKQCGLTVASRSDSGVISSSVSESALSASDTAAPNSANYIKLVLQAEFDICTFFLMIVVEITGTSLCKMMLR